MLKYYNFDIVFQEIPDEVTLAINITNCPHRCVGCHSPHLRQNIGDLLDEKVLDELVQKYKNEITCVCFMGGDKLPLEIDKLANHLHNNSKVKVAWYSGNSQMPSNYSKFDYIKIGPYLPSKGGLKSRLTNQRLYKISEGKSIDITSRFHR